MVWICQHHKTDGLQPSIILKLMGSCFPLKITYAIYPKIDGLNLSIIFKQIISTLPLSSNWWSPPFHYPQTDGLHPSTIFNLMVSIFHYPQTDGLYPSSILILMVSMIPLSSNCSSPCQRHLIVTFRTRRAGLWVHHHDRAMLCSIFCIRLSFLMMLDLDAAIRSSWSEMARSTSASWAFSGSTARSVTLERGSKESGFFHKQFWPRKSETRTTASILKQDPNTEKVHFSSFFHHFIVV